MPDYRFVENPVAPEILCHHLHDVQFIGGLARFVPVTFRHSEGEVIAEQCASIFLPTQAVEPALVLTWGKLPSGVVVPAIGRIMRRALYVN